MPENNAAAAVSSTAVVPAGEENVSIPLYLAGLAVTLCGLQAVNALHDDTNWKITTFLLTLIGFAFSYGCRWLRIQFRVVEIAGVALLAYIIFQALMHQDFFLPAGLDTMHKRFVVMLALVSILLSWMLVNDTWVLFTCIPAMAIIGTSATADPGGSAGYYFCLFLLSACFLMVHQNYLQARTHASLKEQEREQGTTLITQGILALICGLVVLGLALVVVAPVQAIFARFSMAQEVRRLIGAGPNNANTPGVTVHFSDDDNLQLGTGSGWSASTETVMQVTDSDNQEHYWRGRTYDTYDGVSWQSSLGGDSTQLPSVNDAGDSSSGAIHGYRTLPTPTYHQALKVQAKFDVLGDTQQIYYAAEPLSVIIDAKQGEPHETQDGLISMDGGSLQHASYTVISMPQVDAIDPASQTRLRQAGSQYPEDVSSNYLGHMTGNLVTVETRSLYRQAVGLALKGLPASKRDPFDEAMAIRDWVSKRSVYSLSVPAIASDQDHVSDFLFQNRRGYCDMFASSMAVLCRTAGIPARVATGFAPGEHNGQIFILRAMDKHAWVEVFFPGSGWVTFDPTEGTSTDGSVPTNTQPAKPPWNKSLRAGAVPGLLTTAIIVILLYLFKTEFYDNWRGHPRIRPDVSPQVAEMQTRIGQEYLQVTHAIGRLGMPRRPSETPTEYLQRMSASLPERTEALGVVLSPAALSVVTRQFVAACYGPADEDTVRPEEGDQAATISTFLSAAAQAHRKLFWRRLFRQT